MSSSDYYNYPAPLYTDHNGNTYSKTIEDRNKRVPTTTDTATDLFAHIFFRSAQHIDFCTFLHDRGYACNGSQSSNFAFAVAWFLDDVLQKYFFDGLVGKQQAGEGVPVISATYSIFSDKDPEYRPAPSSTSTSTTGRPDRATAFVKENSFERLSNGEARHLYDVTVFYIARLTKSNGAFAFKIKLRSDERRVFGPWEGCGSGSGDGSDEDEDKRVFGKEPSVEL